MLYFFSRAILGHPHELFPLEEFIDRAQPEDALEADMPMVDPHHHLFDARIHDKGWPIPKFVVRALYGLHPHILVALLNKTQHPCYIQAFGPRFPAAVPYLTQHYLRDIRNFPQGDEKEKQTVGINNNKNKNNKTHHNIVATIYVESDWQDPTLPLGHAEKAIPEVKMAQGVHDNHNNRDSNIKLCAGIVGHIPLHQGAEAVRKALHQLVAKYPNFRGIRDQLCHHPAGFYPEHSVAERSRSETFRAGFAVLQEFDATFDALVYSHQLEELQDLAQTFPSTQIILNHIGWPLGVPPAFENPEAALEDWKPRITQLAASCPNVSVKLSGMGMASCGFGFADRDIPPNSEELANAYRPWILHCIEAFGVDRCMFASNFPIDKISGSYTALFNAYKRVVQHDFSQEDKRKLFHDNAVRIYRLQVS